MADLPKMVSYFDKNYSISLEIPENWTASSTEDFPLVFFALRENGYRSNLGFSKEILQPPNLEALEALINQTKKSQQQEYDDYRMIDEANFLQDGYAAYLQHYQWQPSDNNSHFSQVFGLILTGPESLFEIDGATLVEMEEKYFPIFDHIIKSIRFIPS